MKNIISLLITVAFALALFVNPLHTGEVSHAAKAYINNSDLMPKLLPDSQVKVENGTPDWVKTLIMMQFRIETVSDTHDFKGAVKALDHIQELGVNGIWVNPVYQKSEQNRASSNNGYNVYRFDEIDSVMSGTTDKEASFKAAKNFVDEAHKRNIRVLFDIVVWGVDKYSTHLTENPEWFLYNGKMKEGWGGYLFNWSNASWREWYINNAVQIVLKTGIDGFRCDLEPHVTGYALWAEVRRRLWEEHGRKIIIVSEGTNERRDGVYDFEQVGVGEEPGADMKWDAENFYLKYNIVDSVRTGYGIGSKTTQTQNLGGTSRFYTINILTHDSKAPRVVRRPVRIGYQAIFAPFIPFWFIGEEWNNPRQLLPEGTGVMYFNKIQWDKIDSLPDNRDFFESVKKMIRIRRTYPQIFEYYPDNHREVNICKVTTDAGGVQAYARYKDGKGILIIPNIEGTDPSSPPADNGNATKTIAVTIPYSDMGISGSPAYRITDLMTDKVVFEDTAANLKSINVPVEDQNQRVLLVEKISKVGDSSSTSGTGSASTSSSSGGQDSSGKGQNGQGSTDPGSLTDSQREDQGQVSGSDSKGDSEISDSGDNGSSDIDTSDGKTDEDKDKDKDKDKDGKTSQSNNNTIIWVAVIALVIIAGAFAAFYILLKKGKIFK